MKNKALYIGAAFASALILSGCQAEMNTPELEIPVSDLSANISILDLKETFSGKTEQIKYLPGTEKYDAEGNVIDGEHYVIKGRVVSSDASGNVYKSLVIQDETAALTFSINQSQMYTYYRLGQEVLVDMTGLYIGYYRELQQIGAPGEAYQGNPQLGFMAYDYWLQHAQLNGLPNPTFEYVTPGSNYPTNQYYCIVLNDFNEIYNMSVTEYQSQFVEFRNVKWQDAGETNFADYQESANRTLIDANGQTLTVRNSGYSNFYNKMLPEGRGSVRGILSYYGGTPQLVLIDFQGINMTTLGDSKDNCFSVENILSGDYNAFSGWVEGYIVGSVKAGINEVASNDDVIFNAEGEIDNNILIAADKDETDINKCVCIELPQNSQLRYYGNMADNFNTVNKHKIMLQGTIGRFLGMPGIVAVNGSKDAFEIEGVNIGNNSGDTPKPSGTGTEADPYNIGYVKSITADQTGVWVIGYVAGYFGGNGWSNAKFEDDGNKTNSNYANASNIILAEVAPPAVGEYNAVPAMLTSGVKPTLGLVNNPAIFGKRVKVKCDISTDYLGTIGLRKVTEVVLL